MVVDASFIRQLFPEIQREAIGSTLKALSEAISGSKVTKGLFFLRQYTFFSHSFLFWQNGRMMTAWRAYEYYVHQSQLWMIKARNILGPWSKITTMRTNKPFVYYLLRLMIRALIIKITISSIVIGLKNSYFPLIHLPSCYRTVCYRTV